MNLLFFLGFIGFYLGGNLFKQNVKIIGLWQNLILARSESLGGLV